jgi:hypothetical protein
MTNLLLSELGKRFKFAPVAVDLVFSRLELSNHMDALDSAQINDTRTFSLLLQPDYASSSMTQKLHPVPFCMYPRSLATKW